MQIIDQIPILNQLPVEVRLTVVQILIVIAVFAILWMLRPLIATVLFAPVHRRIEATNTQADDLLFKALRGVINYLVIAFAILLSLPVLGVSGGLLFLFTRVAQTLLIFAIFKFIYDVSAEITRSQNRMQQIIGYELRNALMPVTRIIVRSLIIVLGVLTIAQIWQINAAGILAGLGLGGLALSLAAKEVLEDIIGFAVIFGDDVFTLGEYISFSKGDGTVEHIGVRSTQIRKLDQGLLVVPNSDLANDTITNWSRLEQRWFNFVIGVTYDTTAQQLDQLTLRLRQMLAARENVKADTVLVLFTEYDSSSLNIMVRFYVDIANWTRAHEERHAINLEIMRIVNELGVDMAFPSTSLYVEKIPGTRKPAQPKTQPSKSKQNEAPRSSVTTAATYSEGGGEGAQGK